MSRTLARRRSGLRVESLEDRTQPSFVAAPTFPVGPKGGADSHPDGITVADFNRDGKLDVATADTGANAVSVLLGLGNGKFAPAVNVNLGRAPTGLLAVDVNRDGKADLVTADKADDTVTVLLGNGLGGFTVAGTYTVGSGPVALAAADFNGDGKTDLAVADSGASTVNLLWGQGTGKFTDGGTIAVGSGPTSIAVGDFNGDQKPDVATVSGGFGHLNINLNAGGGTFAPTANYATGFCANAVTAADFNHDGKLDLAVGCVFPSGDGVSILLGQGDGTFPTFTNYNAGNQSPRTIATADFNGDGYPDVVTANDQFGNNSVSVLLDNPDGTLNPARIFAAGQQPLGVAVGDFNRDGLADAVTTNTGVPSSPLTGPVGNVAVLLGNGDGTLGGSAGLDVEGPHGVVATDLTGDGLPDLAVVTGGVSYSGVAVFPSLGNGLFAPRLLTTPIDQPGVIAAGDLNGDHKQDLVVTTPSGVDVLLGNGNGTFQDPTPVAVSDGPTWVAVADLNNDGKADLVVSTGSSDGAAVLLGNGDGTFQTAATVAAGGAARYVAVADFNKDGKPDLAVVNAPNNTVSVLFGAGNGTFNLSHSYPTLAGPGSVSVGDFNRDGRPDIAVPTFFGTGASSALTILLNGPGGVFTQKYQYDDDSLPTGSVAGDFTGDGRADVVSVNQFADDVLIYPGTGVGSFGKPVRYFVGDRPSWVAAADFNGDRRPDLVVVNGNANSVTLLQTPSAANHLRVGLAPASVTAGRAVTVTVVVADSAGRPVRGFVGTVSLTSTDRHAGLPAAYTFTAADQGVHKFVVVPRTAGPQTVTAHATGLQAGTAPVDVLPAAANHLRVTAPASTTAGAAFDLTVQALDPFGNLDPAFTGTVHFTTSDTHFDVVLPPDYTFTGTDGGTHTFAGGATLLTAGSRTVTAAALGVHWLTPKATTRVTVAAAALSRFLVSGFPTTIGAGVSHTFSVTAQDAYGNRITNYRGTVTLSSSGSNAALPATYKFTALDLGRHLFRTSFTNPAPNQWLKATDTVDASVTGSETGITVT